MTPEQRSDIERWFGRRGVPQLIEGYRTEASMDRRAAPFISLWLVVGTIREWGTRPDWPLGWNLAGTAATLGWMVIAWAIVGRLRGRPITRPLRRFDVFDVVAIGLLPAVPAAVIDGSAVEAVTATLGALTGIGVIYVIIGFGLIEIGGWAIQRLWAQLTEIAALITRTLPLLLILVVFLLFAAEIWEVAHAMSAAELGIVLLLLLLVAALLVVTTFRRELVTLESVSDPATLAADAAETPVASFALEAAAAGRRMAPPKLSLVERANLTLLVAIPQLVQALAVALVVGTFLSVVALVAIPASVQTGWIGEPARVLMQFELLGEARSVSAELLIVGAILGGIVGLYFGGLAITDPTFRTEQFDRAVAEVRQLLAARAVYQDALRLAPANSADPASQTPAPGPRPGVSRAID